MVGLVNRSGNACAGAPGGLHAVTANRYHFTLFAVCLTALATGALGWLLGNTALQNGAWLAVSLLMLAILAVETVRTLARREAGIDLLALLAIAGAVLLQEYLAGAVIAVMLASGRALEEYAAGRARRELSALLARAPRITHRFEDGELVEIPVAQVRPGDRLLVRPGEVLPVDGLLLSDTALLDESALTGEAMPVSRQRGERLSSGVVNAGEALEMRALADAASSTYAGIVRLAEQAQEAKAPFTRLADRYALLFIPLTLLLAGAAWWWSGDAVRALAVLVVATPCPLILAVPIALVSATSQAARRGILVKSGGALELLAQAEVMMFDKTGTLTTGKARLVEIVPAGGEEPEEVLRLAASVDQVSQHVTAQAIVAEARRRDLRLEMPAKVSEVPGAGVDGIVAGRRVRVGQADYLGLEGDWLRQVLRRMSYQGCSGAFVAIDGQPAGALLLADQIRLETPRTLRSLHRAGIRRTVMVSGDRQDVAETIAGALGIEAVLGERSPAEKVAAVRAERARGVTIMVGDGINDAPALAAAHVGVAMGARGAAASAEAADVVLLVDRLDRLPEALVIARRGRRIALQSVTVGMSLAVAGMLCAAAGWLTPVAGALLQEAIDVIAILNALRALRPGPDGRRRPRLPADVVEHLYREHQQLLPVLDRVDAVAAVIAGPAPEVARDELMALDVLLREQLLPHEREDEEVLYPRLAELLSGFDPLGAMSRTHREIFHLARLFSRLVEDLPEGPLAEVELVELRRILHSLAAILRLHFAQEEELFQSIAAEDAQPAMA